MTVRELADMLLAYRGDIEVVLTCERDAYTFHPLLFTPSLGRGERDGRLVLRLNPGTDYETIQTEND